jgi:hypothetical protein
VSIKELQEYRESVKALDGLVEYHRMPFILLNQAGRSVNTGVVSSNYFDVLGIRAAARALVQRQGRRRAPSRWSLATATAGKFGGDVSASDAPSR